MPVNFRDEAQAMNLGNQFGLVFLALPLGRLIRQHAYGQGQHGSRSQVRRPKRRSYGLLNVFGATPQQVEEQVVNLFGSKATAVTNVPGPQMTLYLAGSRMRNGMFWVPQAGRLGMGISIFSYDGHVTLGVITDASLVPDPETIAHHFEQEFARLHAATELRSATDEHR
ncbi:MAG: WSD1 family O-acyltransferase [Caldilineaceae bacterium]